MTCPICQREMDWVGDTPYEDLMLDGDGVVGRYECSDCAIKVDIYMQNE